MWLLPNLMKNFNFIRLFGNNGTIKINKCLKYPKLSNNQNNSTMFVFKAISSKRLSTYLGNTAIKKNPSKLKKRERKRVLKTEKGLRRHTQKAFKFYQKLS